ncbi:MAG: histidine kinase N-terminal 7TM domain-containing protein [Nocardioidaceae bacterium]
MLPLIAGLMAAGGLVLASLAAYVAWRRGTRAGLSLAVVLVSVSWWGLAYAAELSAVELDVKSRWGDLKYLGICALPPAWFVFVWQYTGRTRRVSRRMLALLAVEPVLILGLLTVDATHDLVRFYPAAEAGRPLPVVGTGPLFWGHLVYANGLILLASVVFVATMVRLARTYRRMALVLIAAALLPWSANLLYNLGVGWFATLDLTPFAFTVTGGVLVWGVFRERLVDLLPLARGAVLDSLPDGVLVLDAFGRVVDVNPAGSALLGRARPDLVGRSLVDLLPPIPPVSPPVGPSSGDLTTSRLTLGTGEDQRTVDVQRRALADGSGRSAGDVVVLRDITERVLADERLQNLLSERSRVAAVLQTSLAPRSLPTIACLDLASRYEPAGDGTEIGGDFFDVFPLGADSYGVVIGDVSGKGAEAAAVTAQARYMLRALAASSVAPSATLRELNTLLLAATSTERHCTLVYAVARVCGDGLELAVSLAGHHPPLLLHEDATVEPVGRLGMPLGLFDDPQLHDVHVRVQAGDLLCLFTDGLVEARDGDGDLFGSERVAMVLAEHAHQSAAGVAGELVAAARRFGVGHDLPDDLAILVLRAVRSTLPAASHPTRLSASRD